MTRNFSATLVAMFAFLVASCGELPTSSLTELGTVPELTAPAPTTPPVVPSPTAPVSCDLPEGVLAINEGFTLEDVEEAPWLLDPYLDPTWLRATQACAIVEDRNPPEYCCPQQDSTGRGHAVPTVYNPDDDEIATFGAADVIRPYPLVVLADESGLVRYVVWGVRRRDRQWPYPTDVPALFFVLEGIPPDVRYGLPMCPRGQVFPRVYPGTAPEHMGEVWAEGFGLLWEFERPAAGAPQGSGFGVERWPAIARAGPEETAVTYCPNPGASLSHLERVDFGLWTRDIRFPWIVPVDETGDELNAPVRGKEWAREGWAWVLWRWFEPGVYFRFGCSQFGDRVEAELPPDLAGSGLEVVTLADGKPAIKIYFGP